MIKELTFIGGISLHKNVYGGETIKNKIFIQYIKENYPSLRVNIIDTYNWQKNLVSLLYQLSKFFFNKYRKVVIVSVSERGAGIFFKSLRSLFWIKKDIYYFITGTLPDNFIKNLPKLLRGNARPITLFTEIEKQRQKLLNPDLPPIVHLNNWKNYNYIPSQITKNYPFKTLNIFTFSRIDEAKGTTIFFEALKQINRENVIIEADLYGIIDKDYKKEFEMHLNDAPYCSFKNTIDLFDEKNYSILSQYDLMVFPTFHSGEGFAGTLIDCFIAGVPVAASDWNYNSEIIEKGINGFLFKAKNVEALTKTLLHIYENQRILNTLRLNCIQTAKKYLIETQLKSIFPAIIQEKVI